MLDFLKKLFNEIVVNPLSIHVSRVRLGMTIKQLIMNFLFRKKELFSGKFSFPLYLIYNDLKN